MQLHFQTYGTGFPLVILHGLFGSSDNWQPVAKKLGERFTVFTVDLRNHGRSPHSEEFSYAIMAEDVCDFLEQRGLSQAHVLGHSMGGKTAMEFALRHPSLVSKLVIVDMAPKAYPPVHVPLFEAMLGLDLGLFRERGEIDAALTEKIPDAKVRQFLLKNVARDETGKFRWKLNVAGIYQNYSRLKEAIESNTTFDGPTLFIKGAKSDHLLAEDMPQIEKLFPKARIEKLANAGHWVHADEPAGIVRILTSFLSDPSET
jgi:pimeloyl-ACP methyl ester carboxylesterase